MTPTLKSSRLRLEPFDERYLTEHYLGWLNDAETLRFSELRHVPQDREGALSYLSAMRNGGHHFWAIERASGEAATHIGNITAYIDKPNGIADLAIMIGDATARGLGLGREAWQAASDWLLADGGVRKLTAGTMATNAAMLATMWASGMIEDGRRHAHFVCEGEAVDLVYGARFAES